MSGIFSYARKLCFRRAPEPNILKNKSLCFDYCQCSVSCGGPGVETRYVACLIQSPDDGTDQIVTESYCDRSTRPDSDRPCRPVAGDCPLDTTPSTRTTTAATRTPSNDIESSERDQSHDMAADWRIGPYSPVSEVLASCLVNL